MIKVGIAGYGTIGKRVAEAVLKSDDMKLVGISKTTPDYSAYLARSKGIKVYAHSQADLANFEKAGFKVEGTIKDLLSKIDIIVDTSPGKMGVENKQLYEEAGVKMIFQGGEKANIAEVSFNAQANFDQAWGKRIVRVVSCNTTGLSRVLHALHTNIGVKQAKVVLIRRTCDPKESKGLVNGIQPEMKMPSHHGPDLNTVIPDIKIESLAVVVPTTLMHLHTLMVEFKKDTTREQLVELMKNTRRVILVKGEHGLTSTNLVVELARDLGRPRYDLQEVVMWEDTINVKEGWGYLVYAVHQEAIVQPENIDAIRAMNKLLPKEESIKKTDASLGIVHGYLYK
ncbi:MAG: type II glyceraldehyde-3-phosphate dehydrogenase [Candidatus Odinarchaeum yellowstonii]|uniref:Glyceraldehyde-3-phosphate dehydrogenase n=1 Tax=Odinarchaeota yellowstonii (strain LCB_4) TaxID=1841599 RepID=A0AAF0I9X4_ODILC|nr:MAG: type II glyceraldehyde-3-phosphate dehydrogenase [Candidatus Odinarchaeum yellowstonii]